MASAPAEPGRRTGRGHADAPQRGRAGPCSPRLPAVRAARHGQDEHGPDSRQGRQLQIAFAGRAGRGVRRLPGHRRGTRPRPDRDRRGFEPWDRRHPEPAREGPLRAQRGALQGLHSGRGTHVDRAGVQRTAQDPGGAAGPRYLRARDDRGAQGTADDNLPVPAVRLPAHTDGDDRRPPRRALHRRERRSLRGGAHPDRQGRDRQPERRGEHTRAGAGSPTGRRCTRTRSAISWTWATTNALWSWSATS